MNTIEDKIAKLLAKAESTNRHPEGSQVMAPFRQAPHDQAKADRDGVTNYIPKRSEPDRSHECEDCELTARWEIKADGRLLYACDTHRREYLFTASSYQERNLR